ncbi:hypothetical protein JCM11491_004386 [Sporobolomyces phaffii]
MSAPRPRAMRPSLKSDTLHQHKPRVPSRLSFSSLPPLPPLPSTSSAPTTLGDLPKRSPSPVRSTSAPKRPRPAPRPRSTAKVTVEDTLASVGAFYVGWESGSRDPAPLCCPVQKEKIKQRFGEAAIGWMTTPEPVPTTIPAMSLPPLPIPTTQPSVDSPQDFLSNFSSYSPSPPSLVSYNSSSSSSMSVSPPAATTTMMNPFEAGDSPLLFTNASETLALPLIKVEDERDMDALSEHLWSSSGDEGYDVGSGFFTGSSGESDASWAW